MKGELRIKNVQDHLRACDNCGDAEWINYIVIYGEDYFLFCCHQCLEEWRARVFG